MIEGEKKCHLELYLAFSLQKHSVYNSEWLFNRNEHIKRMKNSMKIIKIKPNVIWFPWFLKGTKYAVFYIRPSKVVEVLEIHGVSAVFLV